MNMTVWTTVQFYGSSDSHLDDGDLPLKGAALAVVKPEHAKLLRVNVDIPTGESGKHLTAPNADNTGPKHI